MIDEKEVKKLIRRVLRGEKEAFSEIVLGYQDYLYGNVLGQLGDEDLANEITQEVFIRAYKYLGSFKGLSTFKTWITRIAINSVKEYYTSKRYKEAVSDDTFDTAVHEIVLANNDENKEGLEELIKTVRTEITKLSEKSREILILKFINGMSYQEIANELGVPIGTVSSRMNKALLELRTKMNAVLNN